MVLRERGLALDPAGGGHMGGSAPVVSSFKPAKHECYTLYMYIN